MSQAFSGRASSAAETLDRCLALCSEAEETWYRSYALWFSGLLAWQQGDSSRGAVLELEALRLTESIDDRLGTALCLESTACCESQASPRRAAVLLGSADALWHVMGTSVEALPGLSALRHLCEAIVKATLAEGFARAYDEGRGLAPAAAVAFALRASTSTHHAAMTSTTADGAATRLLTRRER